MTITVRLQRYIILFLINFALFFYNTTSGDVFAAEGFSENKAEQAPYMKISIRDNLKKTVNMLAGEIGSRGYLQTEALKKSADYIKSELTDIHGSIKHLPPLKPTSWKIIELYRDIYEYLDKWIEEFDAAYID